MHSHIDKSALDSPSKPWEEADLTGDQFNWLTESTHEILRIALFNLTGSDQPIPEYYGEDIDLIVKAYKKEHPDAPLQSY